MRESELLFSLRYKVASLRLRLARMVAPKGVDVFPPMRASDMIGRKSRRG